MKTIVTILILSITMYSNAQGNYNRIEKTNYFTDGEQVFYILSNILNSSGFFGDISEYKESFTKEEVEILTLLRFEEVTLNTKDRHSWGLKQQTVALPLFDVNPKDFKALSDNYGTSKKQVFYGGIPINADVQSFKILHDDRVFSYAKDDTTVYLRSEIIKDADAKSFSYIESRYSKDKNTVFYGSKPIQDANPNTFIIHDYLYQQDDTHLYYIGKKTDVDLASFKKLEYSDPSFPTKKNTSLYISDKNHVYYQAKIIPDADVNSFKVIVSEAPYQTYGIDKNYVFYNDKILPKADANTFKVVIEKTADKNYDAYDENAYYTRDKREEIIKK